MVSSSLVVRIRLVITSSFRAGDSVAWLFRQTGIPDRTTSEFGRSEAWDAFFISGHHATLETLATG